MATILNKFERRSVSATTTPAGVYTVPYQKAGVIISALASNLTNSPQTVTASISGSTAGSDISTPFTIVQNFTISPNDTYNIVVTKLVLKSNESFIIQSGNSNAVNLTLSVLETANT